MKIIDSEDLFIFNLLSPEESLQLIEYLKLYAELCADCHDPEFIGMIENERVRSAFTYFNNRFARRKPKKKSAVGETNCEQKDEMVNLPPKPIYNSHSISHTLSATQTIPHKTPGNHIISKTPAHNIKPPISVII